MTDGSLRFLRTPAAEQRHELAQRLADLRLDHAEADHVDPHSTLERIPTPAELVAAFDGADHVLVAGDPSAGDATAGDLGGYGLVWSWVEDDGTHVHLLDVWAVPRPDQQAVESELFDQLEVAVRARVGADVTAVLGANCRSTEPARLRLLTSKGFRTVFDMIEMQAPRELQRPVATPAHVALRSVRPEDATSIADLTARVWAGRDYFTMPTLDDVRGWLSRADPELYVLAEHPTAGLIGLASAELSAHRAEIDDVQVDPRWQRQGVATALLAELIDRLSARTTLPLRLHTEGHDPAGARSFYEGLGYTVTTTHHRLRKPL